VPPPLSEGASSKGDSQFIHRAYPAFSLTGSGSARASGLHDHRLTRQYNDVYFLPTSPAATFERELAATFLKIAYLLPFE